MAFATVYDTELVWLTSQRDPRKAEELGLLGYKIMGVYVLEGEAWAVMQRERACTEAEASRILADQKEAAKKAQPKVEPPKLFGKLPEADPCGSSLGYNRRCPVCGNCCHESLVNTSEKPPRPTGEVVRQRSWHYWHCETCKTYTIDPCKFVYDGDGDYRRINNAENRQEVVIQEHEWSFSNATAIIERKMNENLTIPF